MICNKKAEAFKQQILMAKSKKAETAIENQDSFSCSICLEPLEDPVMILCGHNYCMACINNYWNQHEHTGTYRCPECRESFTPRPTLNKNGMFAEVVEQLKKARLRDASPADSKPTHVECRSCTGRNLQATGTFPGHELHARGYNAANLREKHTVIVVSGEPSKNTCIHNMPLEIYCRTDQQLICSLCYVESHRDHNAVAVTLLSPERCKRCRGTKWHWKRSHGHSRKKHKCSGHWSRHGSGNRKNSLWKSTHETGHCESHGHHLRMHVHMEGGGHVMGRPENGQRSSRHERTPKRAKERTSGGRRSDRHQRY